MKRASKKRSRNKKLLICLFVLSGIAMVVLFFYRMHLWEQSKTFSDNDNGSAPDWYETHFSRLTMEYGGNEYVLKDRLETLLLIGLDKYDADSKKEHSYRNTQQSDFLMLLVIDKENKKCTAVQIDRDTMADIPILSIDGKPAGTTKAQLALSHTYGSGEKDSCKNTVKAVSGVLLGLPIDHYLSVTLDSVPKLNDTAGGVAVKIEDDFSGIDSSLRQGETVTLNGEQALTFVRTRKGLDDSTNAHRMERQKKYLTALFDTIESKSSQDVTVLAQCLSAVSPYMVTDCTSDKLTSLANMVFEYDVSDVIGVPGSTVMGDRYMEFRADEDALKKVLIENFFEEKK